MRPIRAAVITISDAGSAGEREDVSGPLLRDLLVREGVTVVRTSIVPDETATIQAAVLRLVHVDHVDLVVTTGGTGPTPRDTTPEATRGLIEREMPGLCEALRGDGYQHTPLAAISRGIAGLRSRTLIINLPGSPKAVAEGMETLAPILPHAIRMVRGVDTEHRGGRGRAAHRT